MEVNQDVLNHLVKEDDKNKNIAVQKAISGNNKANTAVDNTFIPINISSSSVSNLVSSYLAVFSTLAMFSVLMQNKKFMKAHEQYMLKKIEIYESLMSKIKEDETIYKNKPLNLLEQKHHK